MKKLFLSLLVAVFTLSIYSCRETTEDKTEEAVEAVGEDIEQAGEEAEGELEQEVNETDDAQ